MKKTKYEEFVLPKLERVKAWARDGIIEEEIAKRLGIAYSTLKVYKNQHTALLAALKEKVVYDDSVVDALYNNTLGGIVKLNKVFKLKRKVFDNGKLVAEEEYLEEREVEEYYPPNVMAQIYWLNNRRPQDWRQKVDVDGSATNSKIDEFTNALMSAYKTPQEEDNGTSK